MKTRQITRFIKSRTDENGNLLCLIPTCNHLRAKFKNGNTKNYCDKHNFRDMSEFTNWASLRIKSLKRDNYTCVKCGDKREEIEVKIKRRKVVNLQEMLNLKAENILNKDKEIKFKYEIKEYVEMRGNFVVDHIEPIALGGDEWDINNLQTLCLKCNKIKTSQDQTKIAKQRRIEKAQAKNKTLK